MSALLAFAIGLAFGRALAGAPRARSLRADIRAAHRRDRGRAS